jgi:hypothetical protein
MHEQYRRAGAFQQLLGDLLLRFGGFPEDAAEATPAG